MSVNIVQDHGVLFEAGDRVYCEDPLYLDLSNHKTVSGELLWFEADPLKPDAWMGMMKRDDGFLDGGGPNGEWYVRLAWCKHLPAEYSPGEITATVGQSKKGYVPDSLDNFCVTGPNGKLL